MKKVKLPKRFCELFEKLKKIGLFDESTRFSNIWLRNGTVVLNSVVDVSGEYIWVPDEFFWITEHDIGDIKASFKKM